MAYATQLDMEARFGAAELAELTDRADGSVIDAAVVARAIDDAAAEIDGYLASRFALPLVATPEVLVRLNCDMARYYLHDDAVTEAVRNRYTDAVRLLRAIAGGDGGLTVPRRLLRPLPVGLPMSLRPLARQRFGVAREPGPD